MQDELFSGIAPEVKRAIIQRQLIEPVKNTLYQLHIQRRAAEITGDTDGLKAIDADTKKFAAQLAVFEKELEDVK